jgi:ubiquinone/menaquinone biosynthesis C-methylase UbiE
MISGIDQSELMISRAKKKAVQIEWNVGNAEAHPFPAGSFQDIICTLAIHHFKSVPKAFKEVFRAISKGRFAILTSYPKQMMGYWLNEYFPRAMERAIRQMPSKNAVFESLKTTGFKQIVDKIFAVPRDLVHFCNSGI